MCALTNFSYLKDLDVYTSGVNSKSKFLFKVILKDKQK